MEHFCLLWSSHLNQRTALECSPHQQHNATSPHKGNAATSSKKWWELPTQLTSFTKIADRHSAQSVLLKVLLLAAIWQLVKKAFEGARRLRTGFSFFPKNISHRRGSMKKKKHDNSREKDKTERMARIWLVWGDEELGQWSEWLEQRGAVTKLQRLEETWTSRMKCLYMVLWVGSNFRFPTYQYYCCINYKAAEIDHNVITKHSLSCSYVIKFK